ncbi:MAG: hypothetical protein ACI4GO_06445 [Hominenteromicrobium sp.]
MFVHPGTHRCVKWHRAEQWKWGDHIRILSSPIPLAFCFESLGHLMDAVGRAVHTLHVLSSALGRIGSRFYLCVTVRFSERIAARSLFSEYGSCLGAGRYLSAYIAEHADLCIPDAVARMGRYLIR